MKCIKAKKHNQGKLKYDMGGESRPTKIRYEWFKLMEFQSFINQLRTGRATLCFFWDLRVNDGYTMIYPLVNEQFANWKINIFRGQSWNKMAKKPGRVVQLTVFLGLYL